MTNTPTREEMLKVIYEKVWPTWIGIPWHSVCSHNLLMIWDVIHFAKQYYLKKHPHKDQSELRDFVGVLWIAWWNCRKGIDFEWGEWNDDGEVSDLFSNEEALEYVYQWLNRESIC